MEIVKFIAVILTVFLHNGNGQAITSTSSNKGAAEEELDKILNERTTDKEENLADVLGLSEPDSQSYEIVQSQFSSDNMIQPKEASPILRQKRSHVDPCYSGTHQMVQLASGGFQIFPICKNITLTGCISSFLHFRVRKCVGSSLIKIRIRGADGSNQSRVIARKCSCAA